MKRFAKSASAIALAGALAFGAAPSAFAQNGIAAELSKFGLTLDGDVYVQAGTTNTWDAACINSAATDALADGTLTASEILDKQITPVDDGGCLIVPTEAPAADGSSVGSTGSSAGDLLSGAAVLGSAALLSSGGSSEKDAAPEAPAPAPAPAPGAPEKGIDPAAPQKGIDPAAPQKGIAPAAPVASKPVQRGMLAQTGIETAGPLAIMMGLLLAGAALYIMRRQSA